MNNVLIRYVLNHTLKTNATYLIGIPIIMIIVVIKSSSEYMWIALILLASLMSIPTVVYGISKYLKTQRNARDWWHDQAYGITELYIKNCTIKGDKIVKLYIAEVLSKK